MRGARSPTPRRNGNYVAGGGDARNKADGLLYKNAPPPGGLSQLAFDLGRGGDRQDPNQRTSSGYCLVIHTAQVDIGTLCRNPDE